MIFNTQRLVIELEYRGIVPVEGAMDARIDCLRGRVWITERGCADDVVLEAGQSHEISCSGVIVVQALRKACVEVWTRGKRGMGFAKGVSEADM